MSNLINTLFSEAVKVQILNDGDALSVAKYPASASFINVDGVHRFAILGVVNSVNSETTLKVQQAKTVNGTPKDITDAVHVIPADGSEDGEWFIIEVDPAHMDMNNDYKFVTVDVSGAAGSNDTVTLLYLAFGEKVPVTQGDDFAGATNVVG